MLQNGHLMMIQSYPKKPNPFKATHPSEYAWALFLRGKLQLLHRDPFDRILISTAIAEGMTIITADESIQKYDDFWLYARTANIGSGKSICRRIEVDTYVT